MSQSFEEKTIKTTPVFSGRIIDLQVDEVELPNGKTSTRELVKHPGAVAVIPVTEDGKLVLVRQFRKALEKEILEIPAGKLEKGEDPLVCAERELEEETGYAAKQLTFLRSFYTSPGFADEIIYLYLAEQLIEGVAHTDEDEFVEVVEVTLDEALQYIENERIHDAKTVFAVQYLQLRKLLTHD
ncbi:NUDIX hydrolase [Halalkalibacterium halodurans]|uniref:NUDIX hydrolase n=1 Tax=Halalkalibacterium halodurans TaxID=86665 RepID=UPI001067DA98|nr:NUDIX hydrolase [Halalkalibacterium halodurans]TES52823.1 NUDIX hydrolase [Halalkalibacterium halodurans]